LWCFLQLVNDYIFSFEEKTNIFTEWPEFSFKLEKVIKENIKDKYYSTVYHENTLDVISEDKTKRDIEMYNNTDIEVLKNQ